MFEWDNEGKAWKRTYIFSECPDSDTDLEDAYEKFAYTCRICGGWGSHRHVTSISRVRRPELDATPPPEGEE